MNLLTNLTFILFIMASMCQLDAFNPNSKECELANEITNKTIECFLKHSHHHNQCGLGKILLLDYFKIAYCTMKRIHKRSLTIYKHNDKITSELIFQLGHSAYSNPCSEISLGQLKCAGLSIGPIKCVSNHENKCIHLTF